MILHLFDDEKVVNRCINMFEKAIPSKNIFVCIVNNKHISHVKETENLYFHYKGDVFDKSKLGDINAVLIHYLNSEKIDFIEEYIDESCPCYWFVWGADLYSQILYYHNYPFIYEYSYIGYKQRILKGLCHFGYRGKTYKKITSFIRNRITHICSSIDYELIRSFLGNSLSTKQQVLGFTYYPLEAILGDLMNSTITSDNILIGNSASVSNNHLYAFKYLSKLNIGNRKVITPINYAGTEKYKSHVIKFGKKYFKDNYIPLINFLPLEEYNNLLTKTSICIFANWRQEAFGNIVVALFLGAKVFLSKRSPINSYLREKGIHIFDLEDISQDSINSTLSIDIINNNREILRRFLSEDIIINNIKNIWDR